MCRCAERRAEIVGATRAALAGDLSRVTPAAAFVVKSSAEDAAAAFRSLVSIMRGGR